MQDRRANVIAVERIDRVRRVMRIPQCQLAQSRLRNEDMNAVIEMKGIFGL